MSEQELYSRICLTSTVAYLDEVSSYDSVLRNFGQRI